MNIDDLRRQLRIFGLKSDFDKPRLPQGLHRDSVEILINERTQLVTFVIRGLLGFFDRRDFFKITGLRRKETSLWRRKFLFEFLVQFGNDAASQRPRLQDPEIRLQHVIDISVGVRLIVVSKVDEAWSFTLNLNRDRGGVHRFLLERPYESQQHDRREY